MKLLSRRLWPWVMGQARERKLHWHERLNAPSQPAESRTTWPMGLPSPVQSLLLSPGPSPQPPHAPIWACVSGVSLNILGSQHAVRLLDMRPNSLSGIQGPPSPGPAYIPRLISLFPPPCNPLLPVLLYLWTLHKLIPLPRTPHCLLHSQKPSRPSPMLPPLGSCL